MKVMKSALIALLVSASILALAQATPVKGGDWLNFAFNLNDTRYQANSTINSSNIANIQKVWEINSSTTTSTPTVSNGSVYFADWNGNVYSVNVLTGSINWMRKLPAIDGGISSSAAVANGMVFISYCPTNCKPGIFAFNQMSGNTVWNRTIVTPNNQIYGSPIVYNGLIYLGVAGDYNDAENSGFAVGAIYAIDEYNGTIAWTVNTEKTGTGTGGDGVWGSVAIDPQLNSIYFGTANPYVNTNVIDQLYGYSIMSLNATNGKINWYTQIYKNETVGQDNDFGSTPNLFNIEVNGMVYNAMGIGNKNGVYYILNRDNGKMIENFSMGPNSPDGIRGVAGFIYVNSNTLNPEVVDVSSYGNTSRPGIQGIAEAFYPDNGVVAWKVYTPGELTGSVSIVPGAALFGDNESNFYAINISTGNVILHDNFNTEILAGITPAEGYIFLPLAGFGPGQAAGIEAFNVPVSQSSKPLNVILTETSNELYANQIDTLTATAIGANAPYAYTFYFNSANTAIGNVPISGCAEIASNSATATCSVMEPSESYVYGVGVKSGASTGNSATVSLGVYGANGVLDATLPTITISSNSTNPVTGSNVMLTVSVENGIGPFSVMIYNITGNTQLGSNLTVLEGGSNSITIPVVATGSYAYNAIATDEGASIPYVPEPYTFSSTQLTIVPSSPSTSTISSGGNNNGGSGGGSVTSGGGGGGGGGSSRPVIKNTTAGFNVTGVAPLDTFNLTLCGASLGATENYVSPNATGLTINGQLYALSEGKTIQLLGFGNGCTVELYNVSYLPIQHTATYVFDSAPVTTTSTSVSTTSVSTTTLNSTAPTTTVIAAKQQVAPSSSAIINQSTSNAKANSASSNSSSNPLLVEIAVTVVIIIAIAGIAIFQLRRRR